MKLTRILAALLALLMLVGSFAACGGPVEEPDTTAPDGSKSLYVANTVTGKVRMFSSDGFLLVDDEDIDYNTIGIECRHGIHNARRKEICYALYL